MTPPRPGPGRVRLKVCGLSTPEGVDAAVAAGAAYLGFVFYPRSPRHVSVDLARALALRAPPGVAKVALLVDPTDAELDALDPVPLDMVQLHGAETPQRARAVRARGLPVMKAVGVASAADLDGLGAWEGAADQLLLDAKPAGLPGGLPGGNGVAFDWGLVAGRAPRLPWMLAGGLTPGNVAEAVRATGARQVDVSSGVEGAPGQKDPALIAAFAAALP